MIPSCPEGAPKLQGVLCALRMGNATQSDLLSVSQHAHLQGCGQNKPGEETLSHLAYLGQVKDQVGQLASEVKDGLCAYVRHASTLDAPKRLRLLDQALGIASQLHGVLSELSSAVPLSETTSPAADAVGGCVGAVQRILSLRLVKGWLTEFVDWQETVGRVRAVLEEQGERGAAFQLTRILSRPLTAQAASYMGHDLAAVVGALHCPLDTKTRLMKDCMGLAMAACKWCSHMLMPREIVAATVTSPLTTTQLWQLQALHDLAHAEQALAAGLDKASAAASASTAAAALREVQGSAEWKQMASTLVMRDVAALLDLHTKLRRCLEEDEGTSPSASQASGATPIKQILAKTPLPDQLKSAALLLIGAAVAANGQQAVHSATVTSLHMQCPKPDALAVSKGTPRIELLIDVEGAGRSTACHVSAIVVTQVTAQPLGWAHG